MKVRSRSVTIVLALAMLAVGPSSASAFCSLGDDGITYNRSGQPAKFKRLNPMKGMNCPSARYVMNKWLRRKYRRSYRAKLPTRFYDGYVTWYCGKRTRLRWRCDEYKSNTAFSFVAYLL
jgi:hypothetical protein